eukprot:scaffold5975_cov99-Cylindrotheca_fusiformis.AAC.8
MERVMFRALTFLTLVSVVVVAGTSEHQVSSETREVVAPDNNKSDDDGIQSSPAEKVCDAYKILGVQPPSANSILRRLDHRLFGSKKRLEPRLKRWVWKLHGKLLPLLHLLDKDYSPEQFVNLRVLWNKAISSLDSTSPVYEKGKWTTYRMLPRFSRWILRFIPSSWFPRWFHANIELRTAYLNQAIANEMERIRLSSHHPNNSTTNKKRIRLVVLGAGYDTRSIRLLHLQEDDEGRRIDQAWEFDLPAIMNAKKSKMNRYYLESEENSARKIEFVGIDLNDPLSFQSTLMEMLLAKNKKDNSDGDEDDGSSSWTTIVVSEALFLYLQPGVPEHLLSICQTVFQDDDHDTNNDVVFCFADRLKDVFNEEDAQKWFVNNGWTLVDWLPKDGATRHMGIARAS